MSEELKQELLDIIYGADWQFSCTGHQNEWDSQLQLDELYLDSDKEEDRVVRAILAEVLKYDKIELAAYLVDRGLEPA